MMTDEELDRDWKPNGRRPQSTIARSFSAELMDIFRIENSVADLDEQLDKRKQNLSKEARELEALEARIKEMENRLKGGAALNGPSSSDQQNKSPAGSPHRTRAPVTNNFGDQPQASTEKDLPIRGDQKRGGSRPVSRSVPVALPPTPTASEGE